MTSYSLKRAHFHWLFALALLLIPAAAPAKNLDSLLNVLDKCLLERDIYETPKNEKAQQLKELATKTKDKAKALNAWVELSYLEQSDTAMKPSRPAKTATPWPANWATCQQRPVWC